MKDFTVLTVRNIRFVFFFLGLVCSLWDKVIGLVLFLESVG